MTSRDVQQHVSIETRPGTPLNIASQLGPVIGTLVTHSPAADTDDIDNVYTVKNAAINATASGDTTVVALVSGKKLRAFSVLLTVSTQVDVAWKSGASTTKIAAMSFPQYGGMNQDYLPGWFMETDAGEPMVINLSENANVRGVVNYIEV